MKLTKAQEDALSTIRANGGALVMDARGRWLGAGINRTTLGSLIRLGLVTTPVGWSSNMATPGEYRLVHGEGRSPASAALKTPAQLKREIQEILTEIPEGGEVTIVAAWTEDTQEIAPGQKSWRHDLGERPRFVNVTKAHAAMWANRGTLSDLNKARAWVTKQYPDSGRVFVYPTTESDPLGRARRDILSGLSGR